MSLIWIQLWLVRFVMWLSVIMSVVMMFIMILSTFNEFNFSSVCFSMLLVTKLWFARIDSFVLFCILLFINFHDFVVHGVTGVVDVLCQWNLKSSFTVQRFIFIIYIVTVRNTNTTRGSALNRVHNSRRPLDRLQYFFALCYLWAWPLTFWSNIKWLDRTRDGLSLWQVWWL